MQAVYWIFTHPVNRFWLQGESLGHAGAGFFSFADSNRIVGQADTGQDWTKLRNRWEYPHLSRAGLVAVSFVALAIAVS